MWRLTWTAALGGAVIMAFAGVGAAAAAPTPDGAGHGWGVAAAVGGSTYVLLGPSVFGVTVQQDPLAYEAVKLADGTVRGRWSYDYWQSGQETTFSGPVTCMSVSGNRAWIGDLPPRSHTHLRGVAGRGDRAADPGAVAADGQARHRAAEGRSCPASRHGGGDRPESLHADVQAAFRSYPAGLPAGRSAGTPRCAGPGARSPRCGAREPPMGYLPRVRASGNDGAWHTTSGRR